MISKEGPGWRLAKDLSKKNFSFLIGGSNWAVELSEKEWNSLLPIVADLVDQHKQLEDQLMPEESISLEMERGSWWACIDGNKDNWTLKLILMGNGIDQRGLEMFWPVPIAQVVVSTLRTM